MKMIKNRIDNDNWLVHAAPLNIKDPPKNGDWIDIAPCTFVQLALYPDNPFWGERLRKINEQAWFFRQTFTLPETLTERICLQFDGVDYYATVFVNGMAIRFTMGAFSLRIDSTAILVGCGVGLLLGLVGALPPAIRAMRIPIVEGLKEV